METGFCCPECGSYENHWISFSMAIKCHGCGNVFSPDEADED